MSDLYTEDEVEEQVRLALEKDRAERELQLQQEKEQQQQQQQQQQSISSEQVMASASQAALQYVDAREKALLELAKEYKTRIGKDLDADGHAYLKMAMGELDIPLEDMKKIGISGESEQFKKFMMGMLLSNQLEQKSIQLAGSQQQLPTQAKVGLDPSDPKIQKGYSLAKEMLGREPSAEEAKRYAALDL